jgi:hypothetical protein
LALALNSYQMPTWYCCISWKESVSGYLDCYFGTLAFYLFGKITLPHDSPLTHISVGRLMLGLLVNFYDIFDSRTLGSTVKNISAFPPTMEYSESPKG